MLKFKTKTALINFIHTFPLMELYEQEIMDVYDDEMFVLNGFSSSPLYYFFLKRNMSVGENLLVVPNMGISDEAVKANINGLNNFTSSLSNYNNQRFNIISETRAELFKVSSLVNFVLEFDAVDEKTDFKKFYITEKTLLRLIMEKTKIMCEYVSTGIKHDDLADDTSDKYPLAISDEIVPRKTFAFVHINEVDKFYSMIPKTNFTPELLSRLDNDSLVKIAENAISRSSIDTVTLSRVPSYIYSEISDEKKKELTKRIPVEISKNVRLSHPSESISMDYFVMIESLLDSELIEPHDMSEIVSNVYNENFKKFVNKFDEKFPQISSMIDIHILVNE